MQTNPAILSLSGILLGTAVFFIFLLPLKYALVGLFAVLAPFAAIMTRQWKYFFLTLLIIGIPVQLKKTLWGYTLDHICGPGGFDLTMADVALLGLYFHWFYIIAANRQRKFLTFTGIDGLIAISVIISALSLLKSSDITLGFIDLVRIVKVTLLYLYIANNIKRPQEVKFILVMLLAGVLIQSGISIAQYKLGRPLGLAFLGEASELRLAEFGRSAMMRPSGIMQGANTSALYLVSLLPFAFTAVFWLKNRIIKFISVIAFIAGLVTLVITYSRGGWAGFLFAFPVLLFLAGRKGFITYRPHYPYILLSLLLFLAGTWLFAPKIMDRLLHTPAIPIHTRAFLNELAVSLISSNPVLGAGLNNFAESGREIMRGIPDPHNIFKYISENPVVHNLYLLVAAETGVAGFSVFMLILFMLMIKFRNMIRSSDPFVSGMGMAGISFLAGFAVTELFDFSFRLDQMFYLFWTLAGIAVCIERMKESPA